ncbi:hypothetical protein AcV7_004949 [Taiwanofungus camphoratus]|nr:hypothetical protein AcV7_004949 [Antrodia cinnamomea]
MATIIDIFSTIRRVSTRERFVQKLLVELAYHPFAVSAVILSMPTWRLRPYLALHSHSLHTSDLSDSFRCESVPVFSALDRASAIVHPFIGFYDWISDQQRHGLQASTHILRCSSLDLHLNNRCPPISQPFIVQHS